MDGSDDYFDDDIVFDEQTLASIDQKEQQWQAVQQQQTGQRRPIPHEAPLPDPKRQKTAHDYTLAVFALPRTGEDYDEDLPDISIFGNGFYNLPAAQRASASALNAQIRGQSSHTNGASISSRSAPPRPSATSSAAPAAANAPRRDAPPPRLAKNASHFNAVNPAVASGSRRSPAPNAFARLSTVRNKEARDAVIQAVLDGIAASQTRPRASTPGQHAHSSRASPAPAPAPAPSLARASSFGPQPPRNQIASSSSARHPHHAPRANGAHGSRPGSRAPSGGSASVSPPVDRRHSTGAPVRQRTASPSVSHQQQQWSQQQQQQLLQQRHQQQQQQQQQPQPQHQPASTQGSNERVLRIELEALKVQFDQLLKNQQQTAKALEEAQNARYAKEGEVSILRKSIEKTAKDHSAEVTRIKTAREQAEAAQAQLRKEMNAELERIKTEYTFKKHELETSNRKTPWSARTKREHGVPITPVSSSTQRRQQAGPSGLGDTRLSLQTPSRPREMISIPESPPRRTAKLPGFVNAFEPTTPKVVTPKPNARFLLPQASQTTPDRKKGKERAPLYDYNGTGTQVEDLFFNPPVDAPPFSRPKSSLMEEMREEAFPPLEEPQPPLSGLGLGLGRASTAEPFNSSPDEDVAMKEAETQKQPSPSQPMVPLAVPDWTAELHRLVLTHKHHSAKELSLQLLINHHLPATAPPERSREYTACCTKLLQCLGTASANLDETVDMIGEVLTGMGRILCSVGSVVQLSILFDMMKIIALFVPPFIPLLLAPTCGAGSGDATPAILLLPCETVRELLAPDENGLDEHRVALGEEMLGFLEAICWNTPTELDMRLTTFVRKAGVLSVLVNSTQPTSLLRRTIRAFTLMASHPSLPKQFLSFPHPETHDEEEKKDYTQIPHIERMASLLIDCERDEAESRPLKETILHFVTAIAAAHADCANMLLKSQTLLPSIILFLMNITDPLWEEYEEFFASPELVTWTVQIMMRVVILLHHFFTVVDHSTMNLRYKLMVAPTHRFNGLWNMFTVTLGRISYAAPPKPISPENQVKLEQICDLAKDVLELVVDGPELEAIWSAFHVDENVPAQNRTQADEDERAARLLHPDLE